MRISTGALSLSPAVRSTAACVLAWTALGCAGTQTPRPRTTEPTARAVLVVEEAETLTEPRFDAEPTIRVRLDDGVVALPLETYLEGVVSAELPAGWPTAAQRAQAIAARSYALAQMARDADEAFDVVATDLDQVYRAETNEAAAAAVRATRGQVLIADGQIVEAFYHSTCGGHTEDPARVFEQAPDARWATVCDACQDSPRFHWEARLPRARLATLSGLGAVRAVRLEGRTASGRVGQLVVVDADGSEAALPARELRRQVGTAVIRSTRFEAELDRRELSLHGTGFGHGVGMCQWGARGLAQRGLDERVVLARYYGGAEVRRAYR